MDKRKSLCQSGDRRWIAVRTIRMLLVSIGILGGLAFESVAAQYPGNATTVGVTASTTSPAPGSVVSVRVLPRRADGATIAGQQCTASIAAQPGTSASVTPSSFTTAADGSAVLSLSAGDQAGEVRLAVACGNATTAAIFFVGGQAPPAPPATGVGLESGSRGTSWEFLALAAGLMVAAAGAGGWAWRRARN
jgi:hypothetical protein